MTKSVYRTALVDSEEDFVRAEATGSLSAGSQVLQMLMQVPSGATGIPVTKLLGISPGGLNATGVSDSENYYGLLGSIRSGEIEPALTIADPVICMSLFGTVFADWSYQWCNFWSSDAAQESLISSQRIQGIVQLVQTGVLPENVALRQIHADGTYSALTDEDIESFDDFAAEQKEQGSLDEDQNQ
jgi:phage-related protein (TIGR01555 family)